MLLPTGMARCLQVRQASYLQATCTICRAPVISQQRRYAHKLVEVELLQDVERLGSAGARVIVPPGRARNHLVPTRKAVYVVNDQPHSLLNDLLRRSDERLQRMLDELERPQINVNRQEGVERRPVMKPARSEKSKETVLEEAAALLDSLRNAPPLIIYRRVIIRSTTPITSTVRLEEMSSKHQAEEDSDSITMPPHALGSESPSEKASASKERSSNQHVSSNKAEDGKGDGTRREIYGTVQARDVYAALNELGITVGVGGSAGSFEPSDGVIGERVKAIGTYDFKILISSLNESVTIKAKIVKEE